MGVLTSVFIGTEAEVKTLGPKARFAKRLPGLEANGITDVEVSTLGEILTGTSVDSFFEQFESGFQLGGGADEPIVESIPDSIVRALAAQNPDGWTNVAQKWCATEEMEGFDPSNIEPLLRDLGALARRALAEKKRLFIAASP